MGYNLSTASAVFTSQAAFAADYIVRVALSRFNRYYEFCKMEIRHTLKRKNPWFEFSFSNSKLLIGQGPKLIMAGNQKPDFLQ